MAQVHFLGQEFEKQVLIILEQGKETLLVGLKLCCWEFFPLVGLTCNERRIPNISLSIGFKPVCIL